MSRTVKMIIFWVVILFSAVMLWQVVKSANQSPQVSEISYSQFINQINAGSITQVRISKTRVRGTRSDGSVFQVVVPESQDEMLADLEAKGAEIWYMEPQDTGTWSWLTNLAPLLLLGALWYFMIRQMRIATKASAARAASGSAAPPIG